MVRPIGRERQRFSWIGSEAEPKRSEQKQHETNLGGGMRCSE